MSIDSLPLRQKVQLALNRDESYHQLRLPPFTGVMQKRQKVFISLTDYF